MAAIVNHIATIRSEVYFETEQRLRSWGMQCGRLPEEWRRAYRDSTIKEFLDIGNRFRRERDMRRERDLGKSERGKRGAATRKARRENRVSICAACGHLHFGECKRCKGDPKYTALGKQTRSFAPLPVRTITSDAAVIDSIIGKLVDWQQDVLHRRYLFDQPGRVSAKELFISHEEFTDRVAAAIEQVSLMLATRNDSAI